MSIICGTDLSSASGGALEVALAIAKLRGQREVILVHVAEPSLGANESALSSARQALEAQAQAALERPDAAGCTIRSELMVGPPDQTLVNFADTENSNLIVVAARSTSSSLLRLGTTTSQIIARTRVPVIAVRDPAPWLAFARREKSLRVLVGIDDSAVCDLGIQWTHGLQAIGPVEVVLGAIYYPDDAALHYGLHPGAVVDRDPEIERLMTRDLLRRFDIDSATPTPSVVGRARRGLGRIGDHMVELAKEEAVDVIVVGTGQKTGLGKLGSVSSLIVNDAPQSVVCVPPEAQVPTVSVPVLRSALVATDLSQFSNRAVPYAFSVVTGSSADSEVHLVHVVKEDDEIEPGEVMRALEALTPIGAKERVTAHVVRGDDAAKAIAQAAARLGVDVICLCSHGRSGISRALVGSVADRLLRATRLPVLVLRPA
ncbi:MAG: Universal stress protein family [Deltaproteobacteria bacterium]|nr:Universal stress protein family [Deltaproteobacteria bacterium]